MPFPVRSWRRTAKSSSPCLPNGPQVKEVMLGDVVNYMHAGQIFIDCSSISPVVSKEIAAVLAEKGIEMLDAPVSGASPRPSMAR